jgi:hypothetical protein
MINKDFPVPTGLSLTEGGDDSSSAIERMLVESRFHALAETGLYHNLESSLSFLCGLYRCLHLQCSTQRCAFSLRLGFCF